LAADDAFQCLDDGVVELRARAAAEFGERRSVGRAGAYGRIETIAS
jgi:hypothetical protein